MRRVSYMYVRVYVYRLAARIYQRVLEIECGDVILQCIYTRGGRD